VKVKTETEKKRLSRGKVTGANPRLRLRDDFFHHVVDPRQMLEPFEQILGLHYFVKDSSRRLMALSHQSALRMGFQSEDEIIGKTVDEYLPGDLARQYLEADLWVLKNGKPLRNIVEMWFNEQGLRDWIITDKYPLRNSAGEVVGLLGTIQSFESRRKLMAHLGPVGKAVDYIRDHLGDPVSLSEIARHAGFSERQLQRLFRRAFGMPVQQFVIHSRIHAAIHDLTHTEQPIAQIAMKFGFSDQSAFTNKFRRVTGFPPKSYRDQYIRKLTSR